MRIKICGITNVADARLAAQLPVDAIGLNGYVKSPRYVGEEQAAAIVRVLPASVSPVAVLVDPSAEELRSRCSSGVRTVQLHATEPEGLSEFLTKESIEVIVAVGIRDADDLAAAVRRLDSWRQAGVQVAGLLVDARAEGLHGGTGRTAPWPLLAGFEPGVPLYLAGGLTPESVAEAVRIVRPFAVDVAGGVESSPGKKDADKLRRFVEAARDAAARFSL